jgi:beta-lactamase regulating signal transducer with metallopeptidase domain
MMAALMVHAFSVALLCAGAAWLMEAALAAYARPRRFAWAVGLAAAVLVPVVSWFAPPLSPATAAFDSTTLAGAIASHWADAGREVLTFQVTRTSIGGGLRPMDVLLGAVWVTWSVALLMYFTFGWRRLSRSARGWQAAELHSHRIDVSEDIGPAVFGVFRSRIVFPRWLLDASAQTQALALRHEREHVTARDPLLLAIATGVVLLMPWNLPLWWMLRRLRFALEIDCDQRVIHHGADSTDYGLALLSVSERQRPAPFATVALIERPSQLEQRIRIMFATPRKLPAVAAGACFLLAASCLYAATQMGVPAPGAAALKPPPGGEQMMKLGHRFEQYIGQRYSGLFDRKVDGTPVVIMLVNDDMTIAKSAQIILAEPIEKIEVDESMFASIGMKREQVPYAGAMAMQSPTDPAHKVLAVYTEKKGDEERFVSRLFANTRSIDRDIYRQHFPALAKNGVPQGVRPWVLIDRDGHVLRSGQDTMPYDKIAVSLESRFAGIKTREVTVTPVVDGSNQPVTDAEGRDVQLTSVWLAPESPAPGR